MEHWNIWNIFFIPENFTLEKIKSKKF